MNNPKPVTVPASIFTVFLNINVAEIIGDLFVMEKIIVGASRGGVTRESEVRVAVNAGRRDNDESVIGRERGEGDGVRGMTAVTAVCMGGCGRALDVV